MAGGKQKSKKKGKAILIESRTAKNKNMYQIHKDSVEKDLVEIEYLKPNGNKKKDKNTNENDVHRHEIVARVEKVTIDERFLLDLKDLSMGSRISRAGLSTAVYNGRYKTMDVAVKVLESVGASSASPESMNMFVREVMILSRVNHDNVIKFIGASTEPNFLIVTELIRGGSLTSYLYKMRPRCPNLEQSISFAIDISRAMEFLHSNGIIHRGLQPANLLLTEDFMKLKLGDFGLARESGEEKMASKADSYYGMAPEVQLLPSTRLLFLPRETVEDKKTSEAGTYYWIAPEVYIAKEPIKRGQKINSDHKVDVYSFAMVLWELLTNCTPFDGMPDVQALYAAAIMNERPSVDKLPKDLVPLIESCWAGDPTLRLEFTEITTYLLNFLNTITLPSV